MDGPVVEQSHLPSCQLEVDHFLFGTVLFNHGVCEEARVMVLVENPFVVGLWDNLNATIQSARIVQGSPEWGQKCEVLRLCRPAINEFLPNCQERVSIEVLPTILMPR